MQTLQTHYSIDPIDIILDENELLGKLDIESNMIPGKIIALDIYPKEAITFTVLLDNGTIYNYVPAHWVFGKKLKKNFMD